MHKPVNEHLARRRFEQSSFGFQVWDSSPRHSAELQTCCNRDGPLVYPGGGGRFLVAVVKATHVRSTVHQMVPRARCS